jgi:phospholipid/cholesterol/gamma-HCH transport system substrate-binding protein
MNWLQNIIVGLLFFGALFMVGYFTIISESGPFVKKGERLVVYFNESEGIKKGTRVTVLGVPIGNVSDIELFYVNEQSEPVPAGSPQRVGQRVAITLDLRQPVVFYDNYRVSVRSASLLSDPVIAIDPGTMVDPKVATIKHAMIPVLITNIEKLEEEGMTAFEFQLSKREERGFVELQGETVKDIVGEISGLISDNREDVKKTIDNIAEITDKINRGKGTIGMLVNDDGLHKNANTLIEDAGVVVKEARESLEDTREQAPVDSFIRAILSSF